MAPRTLSLLEAMSPRENSKGPKGRRCRQKRKQAPIISDTACDMHTWRTLSACGHTPAFKWAPFASELCLYFINSSLSVKVFGPYAIQPTRI